MRFQLERLCLAVALGASPVVPATALAADWQALPTEAPAPARKQKTGRRY